MRETQFSGRDFVAVAAIVLIWGTNFVVMKVALRSFTPFELGAARFLLAAIPLIFIVPAPRLPWKWIVLYGLFQGVGQMGLLFVSLRVGMTAALASVLLQTQMFFTAVFSSLALAEMPRKAQVLGMAIAALGLSCFAMNYIVADAATQGGTTVLGFALCLGAASMWGVSNIVVRLAQRDAPGFDALGFLVLSCAVPVLPFVALTLLLNEPAAQSQRTASSSWQSWLAVVYLSWIATILAYTMWTNLIKRHGANKVAPFSLGVPVVGIASGVLLLGEQITTWQCAGIMLTVLALAYAVLGGARSRPA